MTSEVHHLFGPITSENQTEFWPSGQRNQWPCMAEISGPLASVLYTIVNYIEKNTAELPHYGNDFTQIDKGNARKVAPFEFTNQEGQKITGDFVEGKVWVACYFFTTCPTICPRMIAGMGNIQQEFASEDRLKLVSFTVDPKNDTPEVLQKYAQDRNIDTRQCIILPKNGTRG